MAKKENFISNEHFLQGNQPKNRRYYAFLNVEILLS